MVLALNEENNEDISSMTQQKYRDNSDLLHEE